MPSAPSPSRKDIFSYFEDEIVPRYELFMHECPEYSSDLHNQIRMAFSHLSREHIMVHGIPPGLEELIAGEFNEALSELSRNNSPNASEVKSEERTIRELRKAADHVRRGKLDIDKSLYGRLCGNLSQYERIYAGVPKDAIAVNGMPFISSFHIHSKEMRKAYSAGKVFEALGFHDRANREYERAADEAKAAQDLFQDNKKRLEAEREKQVDLHRQLKLLERSAWLRLCVKIAALVASLFLSFGFDWTALLGSLL